MFQEYGGYGTSEMIGSGMSADPLSMLLAGSGWVIWLGMMIWQKVFNKEQKSHDQLIDQLSSRITTLEDSHRRLERLLDQERMARREEQNKVHLLELYVVALKAELRRHGIEVPAPVTLDDIRNLLGHEEDRDNEMDQPSEPL